MIWMMTNITEMVASSIPPKSTFKFQELAAITGVKPYVLRFWETEFPEINPVTDETGEKHYSRADVEIFFRVKELLFDRKLSIPAAKVALQNPEYAELPPTPRQEGLAYLNEALREIKAIKARHSW